MNPNPSRSSGNVLFLILIAVALFAALSYAVTSSSRGGGTNSNQEKAQLGASRLINYTSAIRGAALRLTMTRNCRVSSLSFESPPFNESNIYTEYPNSTSPSDKSCHIFHPNGGGVFPLTNKLGGDVTYSASVQILGHYQSFLIIGVSGLSLDICKDINTQLGYNPPTYNPNIVPYAATANHFTGPSSMVTTGAIVTIGQQKTEGCVEGTGGYNYSIIGSGAGKYWYFSTIIPY